MDNENQKMKCDECGKEFEPPDGDTCALCLRPFCVLHLVPSSGGECMLCLKCGGGK